MTVLMYVLSNERYHAIVDHADQKIYIYTFNYVKGTRRQNTKIV